MSKHPLLPGNYSDVAVQSAILFALKPYKITDRPDISNPQLKWNLNKAWQDAQALIARRRWQYMGDEDTSEAEYALLANTDKEIDEINIIIAGIVACQMLDPESEVGVRRIEHRKGGEMALIVAAHTVEKLNALLPQPPQVRGPEAEDKAWWKILGPRAKKDSGNP